MNSQTLLSGSARQAATVDAVKSQLAPLLPLVKPSTTELMINPDGSVFVERGGKIRKAPLRIESERLLGLIGLLAGLNHQVCNAQKPYLELRVPEFFSARLSALIPPLVDAPSLTFRFPPRKRLSLSELVERGTLTESQGIELSRAVAARQNIIVSGHTGSGKTTIANALLDLVDEDRVVVIEDTPEIHCGSKNTVSITTGDPASFTTREAVIRAMRMRPDRIVVGEVRDGEAALELLKAILTHPGTVSTRHADSAAEVRLRLYSLLQEVLAGTPTYDLIDRTLHCVVHVDRVTEGGRSIRKVTEIIRYNHTSITRSQT